MSANTLLKILISSEFPHSDSSKLKEKDEYFSTIHSGDVTILSAMAPEILKGWKTYFSEKCLL